MRVGGVHELVFVPWDIYLDASDFIFRATVSECKIHSCRKSGN